MLMQNVTSNQLLLHLFHEDHEPDCSSTEMAFLRDACLQAEYEDFADLISALKTERLEPDDRILRHILSVFTMEKNTHPAS